MKSLLLMLATLVASATANASDSVSVKCDVQTIADAQACIDRVAEEMQDYEEPNEGFVSEDKAAIAKTMALVNFSAEEKAQVEKAGFLGAVVVHMDEHHLVYFAVPKGKQVTPVEIYDFNTVDLEYIVSEETDLTTLTPAMFVGGVDVSSSDIDEVLTEQLVYAAEDRESRQSGH